MPGRSVLALEMNDDLVGLLDTVLNEDGYIARAYRDTEITPEEILQFAPDCLIMDMSPRNLRAQELLQSILDAGARFPLILTTTNLALSIHQLKDLTLPLPPHVLMPKPFDLVGLESAITDLLAPVPNQNKIESGGTADQIISGVTGKENYPLDLQQTFLLVAESLHAQKRNVIARWVQSVADLDGHARRRFMRIRDVIDHMPVVLDALIGVLQSVTPDGAYTELEPDGRCYTAVRDHAEQRRKFGFEAIDVIREHQIMRDEILLAIWRAVTTDISPLSPQLPPDQLSLVQFKAGHVLDRVIVITLAYFQEKSAE